MQPAGPSSSTHALARGSPTQHRRHHDTRTCVASKDLQSEAERFVATLEAASAEDAEADDAWDVKHRAQLQAQLQELRAEVGYPAAPSTQPKSPYLAYIGTTRPRPRPWPWRGCTPYHGTLGALDPRRYALTSHSLMYQARRT